MPSQTWAVIRKFLAQGFQVQTKAIQKSQVALHHLRHDGIHSFIQKQPSVTRLASKQILGIEPRGQESTKICRC